MPLDNRLLVNHSDENEITFSFSFLIIDVISGFRVLKRTLYI